MSLTPDSVKVYKNNRTQFKILFQTFALSYV